MRQLNPVIIAFIVVLLLGCQETKHLGGIENAEWNQNVCSLTGQLLNVDSALFNVLGILPIDSLLFLKQKSRTHEYSIYKQKDDSLLFVNHFISRGDGPSEVNAVRLYDFREFNMLVAIAFNVYGKIMVIPYGPGQNIFDEKVWGISQNKVLLSMSSVIPVDTANYILRRIISNEDNMFTMYEMGDDTLRDIFFKYPKASYALRPEDRSNYIYDISMMKRPGKKQFVFSNHFGHYIQIFSLKDDCVSHIITVFEEQPKYNIANGEAAVSGSTKYGFAISVSENYIFISDPKIVVGSREQDIVRNGIQPGYSKELYVCDWEGNPKIKYILDWPVSYCAVDKNEKYLYAVTYDDTTLDQAIVRFSLAGL